MTVKRNNMKVEVAYPECVHIELVQSNDLRHYEIFGSLFSAFLASAVGCWVAYLTTDKPDLLWWVSTLFTLFSLIFLGFAGYFRWMMGGEKITKQLNFK